MKTLMYTIKDGPADFFMAPFCVQTRGEAVRMWSDAANDPQSKFAKHPSDYGLFEIGVFDAIACTIELFSERIFLGLASSYKKEQVIAEAPEARAATIPLVEKIKK